MVQSDTASKWLVLARNEYRVSTGRVRRIRPYIPYLAAVLLFVHIAFIAPAIVNIVLNDVLRLLLSQVAVATVQVTLFTMFFYFMIMPITETLREVKTGRLEILLAAPIRPSDLLLGEYLGELPFYAILIAVVGGLFTAILAALGLGAAQMAIVILILVLISLSAFWIGIVIAAVLRTRFERLAAGKDLGGALAMMLPLPLVAILYAAWGGGLLDALSNPEATGSVRAILGILPSSWGSELIVDFVANPGIVEPMALLSGLGGLVGFFVASLWFGARIADRAYSLEQTSMSTSTVKADGVVYKAVRRIGGGRSSGVLLLSIFKEYVRRLENLSNIAYILGILVLINVFLVPGGESEGGPPTQILTALFLYPILIVMSTGGITVDGKENLFIYRKAPSGVSRFLRSVFLRSLLVMVPITSVPAMLIGLVENQPIESLLVSTAFIALIVAGLIAFVMGLFLINPAFTDRSPRLWINVIVVMGVQIGLFIATMFLLSKGGSVEDPLGGVVGILSVEAALTWVIGFGFLLLGKRKLETME